MSKNVPPISKYMSLSPHTIGPEQTLATAREQMHRHQIRHLPVLQGGKLIGVLSDRDIALIGGLRDVDPGTLTVEDAMSQEPFSVRPDSLLTEVAKEMAAHRYGAAVVLDNAHVVGVFTAVDACRALSEVFETRLR